MLVFIGQTWVTWSLHTKIYENCELGFFVICFLLFVSFHFSNFQWFLSSWPNLTPPTPNRSSMYFKLYPMGTGWPQCEGIIYLHPFKWVFCCAKFFSILSCLKFTTLAMVCSYSSSLYYRSHSFHSVPYLCIFWIPYSFWYLLYCYQVHSSFLKS